MRRTTYNELHSPAMAAAIAILVGVAAPVFAQRDLKDIPPPDPELERKALQVAEGFEVNLFAADPKIAKPIQMNFDPAGRLWVASSSVYPHIKPGEKADDKVLVLEDTDGDGRADKTTVFADGLLIPTGVEPAGGGAYVANSTELVHFKDTDGDGRADTQRVVLSGFGTEDTHHILHTLRWGPEGLLYMNQSIYIHSHIETPWGVRRLNGGGIWQFRPETMRLDVYARGWINSWGHQLDEYGQSFVTDGAGGEGINFVVPGAAYPTAVDASRILHGLNPGSPKYCGLEIVGGRHLPDDWQGNILTNDFRAHRVCRFVPGDEGSGFTATQKEDLIKTNHVAFRPVDIKMGPDGAIYIADWYNPIIQHGEVDFRDPRRDHVHGRIWRVTYKGRKLVERPKLVGASTRELLDALKAPEMWTRQNAKRVLKERAAGTVGQASPLAPAKEEAKHPVGASGDACPTDAEAISRELAAWVKRLDPHDPLVERHRLEALWMHQSLRTVEPRLLETLLNAKDHRVRAAATRVIGHWRDELPNSLELLAKQVEDRHPRVRLEAVRVLGGVPDPRSVEIATRALDRPVDEFLDYALWLTARELEPLWLPRVQAGETDFGGNAGHLIFSLKSVGTPAVVAPLVRLLGAAKLSPEQVADVLDVIGSLGGPAELRLVFDAVLDAETGDRRRAALLSMLAETARRRNVRPADDLAAVGRFLASDDESLRSAAARCAGLWKLEPLRGKLVEAARAASTSADVRRAALDGLASLGGDASRSVLRELAGGGRPVRLRAMAVAALADLDLRAAADPAVKVLADVQGDDDPGEVLSAFLQRKEGPDVLARAVQGKKLPADVAKLALRVVGAAGREEAKLTAALREAGGIEEGTGPTLLTPEEMRRLVAEVAEEGDPHRGEAVFRRNDLACFKCHAIGGAGGLVGPDLASIGAAAQVDYLIDSLLAPNKAVKENYHTLVVATDEGKVYTGIKVRQTDAELILRDAEDREVAVPLGSIEEQVTGASIMPAGLTEKLTRRELVDLVRFLSELGKVGPFSLGKEPVVRRWRAMSATDAARYRLRRAGDASAASDDPAFAWEPVYSAVSGELPLADLPEVRLPNPGAPDFRRLAFVRFEVDVTTPGECSLRVNSTEGLHGWLGTVPIRVDEETRLNLQSGTHRLTFAVDLARRNESLRVEMAEPSGSPARVQIVGGK